MIFVLSKISKVVNTHLFLLEVHVRDVPVFPCTYDSN